VNARARIVATFGRSATRGTEVAGSDTFLASPRNIKGSSAPSAHLRRDARKGALVSRAFFIAAALTSLALLAVPAAASAAEPTVTLNPVAEHSIVTAQASGTVAVPADAEESSATTWCFEYARVTANPADEQWQLAFETCGGPAYPGMTEDLPNASHPSRIYNLAPSTEYVTRLLYEHPDDGNTPHMTAASPPFTTDPAAEPVLALDAPGSPSFTSVHLSGTINPEEGNVDTAAGTLPIPWQLQVKAEGGDWTNAGSGELSGEDAESPDPTTVEANATGLSPDTTYKVRLLVHYAGLTTETPEVDWREFTTEPLANHPTVTVDPASEIARTHAHLAGHVDPHGGNVDALTGPVPIAWSFEYTKASEPGAWQPVASGTLEGAEARATTEVHADLTGLHANTDYLFRLTASSAGESATPAESTFETASSTGPDVLTEPATHVNFEHAYLAGTVNPNEEQTKFWFEWGETAAYGHQAPALELPPTPEFPPGTTPEEEAEIRILYEEQVIAAEDTYARSTDAGSGVEPVRASTAIGGLQPQTEYHFRLVAENDSGTTHGSDLTFTTASEPAPESCPNELPRSEQHSAYLPDCRAYELVSPPFAGKNGNDVMEDSSRDQVAVAESAGLPMAVTFASLGAFGDAVGTGIATEYLSQRDGVLGTSGWSTHAITPPQENLSFIADAQGFEDQYQQDFSQNLTKAAFLSWSPLTEEPNSAQVPDLYTREDLRSAGPGTYTLLTPSFIEQPPLETIFDNAKLPSFGEASADFRHAVYQSRLDLTPGGTGSNVKLYRAEDGAPRLITNGSPGCAGRPSISPCSAPGAGVHAQGANRVISRDGSRVNFTAPVTEDGQPSNSPGAKLYQRDDAGTPGLADDAVIQLNASEDPTPTGSGLATYQTSSTDGSRVFFTSNEQLTATEGSGLYMWARSQEDEVQQLAVDAEGGTFTLTAQTQPSTGSGNLTEGSEEVTGVGGSFTIGQTVEGDGIAPGTTITAVPASNRLELSQPATETRAPVSLTASVQATTDPLPFNATAAEVQSALEKLHFPLDPSLPIYGQGNVRVTGGPGDGGATTPYRIAFTGALHGVAVMPILPGGTALVGAGHGAIVSTANPVRNLTLIGNTPSAAGTGVVGASDDGHWLYFIGGDQLVSGGPALNQFGLYAWNDADGTPGGSLSFIGGIDSEGFTRNTVNQRSGVKESRVTPDGRRLLFTEAFGSELEPRYPHGVCPALAGTTKRCQELYVYNADTSTPLHPDVVCASCDLASPGAPFNTAVNVREHVGGSSGGPHLDAPFSGDGRRVFFSTNEPLVTRDTNGRYDAYEYDTQSESVRLLSSGTDPSDSYFLGASADASDAFIATRQRLLGWDTDASVDIYDVRAGGGFTEPPGSTSRCEGETCPEAAPPRPAAAQIGSGNPGSGNPPPRIHCPKGRHTVRAGGKIRCNKRRHHRPHKRIANDNRRVGR
jgi:hypothetical protein